MGEALAAVNRAVLAGLKGNFGHLAALGACGVMHFAGATVWGWSSTLCAIFFMGGIQLLCLGVIGQYIGKIYSETKARPRFIISEKTFEEIGQEEGE